MKNLLCLLVCLANILHAQTPNPPAILAKTPFSIGETVSIHSQELGEDRLLNIYLPSGYNPDSSKAYPIIYLLDGSADEDFIHVAGLVQFGTFTWVNMLPESIVVGIANIDRKRDFTFPTTIQQDKIDYPTTGGSAGFIRFLDKELVPFIRKNYKSNGQSTLIGQSLGGLLATEVLLKQPDLFTNYIIVSPSLWWDNESLLKHASALKSSNKSIYIAVGKGEPKEMIRSAKALQKKIKDKNMAGFKLEYKLFKDADHGNILHLALYDAFEWMF